ncbi:MAG: NYN domain-containing protein, partial [Acidiferrobacterales bacterium]|nr:NYN domain-containing protein [Acidiferrobacterales bacterium]
MPTGNQPCVSVFVDVQNIYYASRSGYQRSFDYNKFWAAATQNRQVVNAIAYAIDRGDEKPMQQVEFIPLSDRRVLVVLIINDKEVQNRIIHTERDYSKDDLDEFA